MSQSSLKVTCKDCEAEFEVSPGEQSWYAKKGWELPKRCKACRDAARQKREQEKGAE